MKLLTLNTHSLVEEKYEEKLKIFVDGIVTEKPDRIALQEVNQSISESEISADSLYGFTPCGNIPVRSDNHVYNAVKMLCEKGVPYYWTWLGIKRSYEKYEEGIAVLSLSPISEIRTFTISTVDNYNNWKTRRIAGIRTEMYPDEWFYSVHFGWWNDKEEPFRTQWEKLSDSLDKKKKTWLMGDFNSLDAVHDEGYELIESDGWHDSFCLAETKDKGFTVGEIIDGWENRVDNTQGMRVDYIWCSAPSEILSSQVIFDGENYPVVSDHYGVIINVKE